MELDTGLTLAALDEENMELRDEIQGEVEDTVGLVFERLQFNSKYGWEEDVNTRTVVCSR